MNNLDDIYIQFSLFKELNIILILTFSIEV